MRILIIEDEHYASKRLESMIQKYLPEGRILDVIDTVEHAVDWINKNAEPNLIFLDIQLADGLSFQIFQNVTITCPIIFTTAHDEYAIKAFKVNSIDYLLKPLEEDHFAMAVEKYKSLYKDEPVNIDWKMLNENILNIQDSYKSRFLIKSGNSYSYLNTSDIKFIFSEDGLSFAVNHQDKKHILDNPLDKIESTLNPDAFFRISRKYIIALPHLQKVDQYFNNRLKIDINTKHELDFIVSREKVKYFKQWLDK